MQTQYLATGVNRRPTASSASKVAASRIDTISFGKERPIAEGSNESAWAQNRNARTAIVSGAPDTTLPMRAEDNWNIQTTAAQVLQVLAAMTAHASSLLFHGGALKSQMRAAADPASVDWTTGWPGDV